MHEQMTGQEVRSWRKANGWTQSKLGDVLGGLGPEQVYRIEVGKRTISPAEDRLLRILIRRELPEEFRNRISGGEPGIIPLAPDEWRIIEALARRVGQTPEGWVAARIRNYLRDLGALSAEGNYGGADQASA